MVREIRIYIEGIGDESEDESKRDCWRMFEGFHPSDIALLNRQNDCVITHRITVLNNLL
jgi:hypothetical protein